MEHVSSTVRVPPCFSRVAAASWWRRSGGLSIIAFCLGVAAAGHAQTPGNPDPGFTAGSYGSLSVLGLQPDGKILLGGLTYGPARVNPDGTPDDVYNAAVRPDAFSSSLAAQPDGRVLISEQLLFRVNVDGTVDDSFQEPPLPSTIDQILVQPDGRIVVIYVDLYPSGPSPDGQGYETAVYTGVERFLTDGSRDDSFTSGLTQFNLVVSLDHLETRAALQPNGQLLVSNAVDGFYRLNADGSLDTSFSASTYDAVSLAVQPDGKILVGTDDTSDNGASNIVRLNADGSVDTGFNANTGSSSRVNAIAVQPDGEIIVGGLFGQVNGVPENNFARLNADGSVDTTFVGPGYGNVVNSLLLQPDGKVLVEGVAGLARYYAYTPVTTSPTAAAGMVGQPFTYQITANNAPASFTTSLLPDGLSLDAATGVISGTPTGSGIFQITLGTRDAAGTSTGFGTLTLTVPVVPVIPVIVGDSTADGLTSEYFSYRFRARNSPTSFGASGLPDGVTVDATSGFIGGYPTVAGNFVVTLSATNSAGTGTATLNLTINYGTPEFIGPLSATAQQGQAFSYQIRSTNSPTNFTADGLPDGLTVDAATGLISGVPTTAGTFSVALAATSVSPDGYYSSADGTLSLTVTPAPVPAPVITSVTTATAQQGQPFTYQIAASNTPTGFAASGFPVGVNTDATTGLVTGVPREAGTFTVTLQATNGGGTGQATLTLTVAPLPVATLTATTPAVVAGSGNIGEFTLSLSPAPTSDVVINFTITGTAADGTDYVFLKSTKKIKAGSAGKPIKVVPLGDGGGAGVKRTVVLTLQPGDGYTVGTTGKVKVKISGQ